MKPLNWGFGVSIFGIIIMDKYMKNKYIKVILLTLGLIFVTSSMSRAPYPYNSGRPNSNSVSYEDVYLPVLNWNVRRNLIGKLLPLE
jgi:hypothetical protein